jgi:hypothetical protein
MKTLYKVIIKHNNKNGSYNYKQEFKNNNNLIIYLKIEFKL